MSGLADLYQEVILDHNRRPRNFRVIDGATCQEGYNPLCGDRLKVYVSVADGRIADVAFEGSGCAISKASASLMTEALKGRTLDEARGMFDAFQGMVTSPLGSELPALGKLAALAGVREFPARVKCASLAWHTLRAALEGESDRAVSTE
jgi:nitrogen fixation protein NifU and related proteins